MMYRTHCQRILDTVIGANFDEVNYDMSLGLETYQCLSFVSIFLFDVPLCIVRVIIIPYTAATKLVRGDVYAKYLNI